MASLARTAYIIGIQIKTAGKILVPFILAMLMIFVALIISFVILGFSYK